MKASSADPCMYFLEKKQHEEDTLVLCFHVIGGLLLGVETQLDMFLQKLAEHFEVTVSKVDNYLGLQIQQTDDGGIEISQTAKVVRLLERYGMSDANPVKLPLVAW